METLTGFRQLCGFVVFMLLSTFSRVQTCEEAPSSPRCFRRKAVDSVYRCEWHLNAAASRAKYDLFYQCYKSNCSKIVKFASTDQTWAEIIEEKLIQYKEIDIWVEAHVGNETCTSSRWSAVLNDTVKYDAPDNISPSWSKTNLTLRWRAVENFPAEAQVRYRRMISASGTEPWTDWKANTTSDTSTHRLTVVNLRNSTAYQVQIRHLSRRARNPLWSDWSPLVTVPTEMKQICGVNFTLQLVNGIRSVNLTWKPASPAAAVSGVTYTANIMFPSECPGKDKQLPTQKNWLVANIFHTAVNISLRAKNAVGDSHTEIHIPAESSSDLAACKDTSLNFKKRTFLHLYELREGDIGPKEAINLTAKMDKHKSVKNYTRYLYFEHKCHSGKPQLVKMCLFYNKEGVPVSEPFDLGALGETHNSVNLSWKAIPLQKLQGFLTHYSLCVREIHPEEKTEECLQINASTTNYRLENLTPGAKYNITLAAATRKGEGPKATASVNTLPEKHQGIHLALIFILLFVVFLILPLGTWIFTRLKSKILPPIPTPVILNFTTCRPESQMIEMKGEMDEVMLQQLHSEDKPGPADPEETTLLGGDSDTEKDGDAEDRSDSRLSEEHGDESSPDPAAGRARESEENDLEQVDNEITMLIYRNGLVFDMKTDLP